MIEMFIKIAIPIAIMLTVIDIGLLFGFGFSDIESSDSENNLTVEDKPLVTEEDQHMIDEYGSVGIDIGDDRILIITEDDYEQEEE